MIVITVGDMIGLGILALGLLILAIGWIGGAISDWWNRK